MQRGESDVSRFPASEIGTARIATRAMVFLGAILAFGMEPIVGRLVTPFFGGAAHVWIASLMIFQALLLLGYLYAHLVAPRIGSGHLLILLLPLLQWPLGFVSEIAPDSPTAVLIAELLRHVSLPFTVLCTTAVVAQSWWHQSPYSHTGEPYTLYVISNMGALVSLLAYPFLVEPLFGVSVQRWTWSVGYLLYAAATVWTWHLLRPTNAVAVLIEKGKDEVPLGRASLLHWLILSAAPSALLLAVTNVIAMEIGSFSLVWVIPLALYLASFIVAFSVRDGLFVRLSNFWPDLAALALVAHVVGINRWTLPLILFAFFALCVSAHRQLYRLRPHPSRLTAFYLVIAIGGWLGGILVSLVAPMALSGLQEYPLAVLAVVTARWLAATEKSFLWWKKAPIWKGGLRLAGLMVGGTAFIGIYWITTWESSNVYAMRNFYGVSHVRDFPTGKDGTPAYRALFHGATVHGVQYLEPTRQKEPLGYYHPDGSLYKALSIRHRPARVAMVGLGIGSSLSWFDGGEQITVYEIDPDMERLARNWFAYLSAPRANVTMRTGDARLNLLEEMDKTSPRYDAIFVDAFSGDAVPTHLLTSEALDIYLGRMNNDGILVFHISNRFYDLRPVLKAVAEAHGLAAAYSTPRRSENMRNLYFPQVVVIMARSKVRLAELLASGEWTLMGAKDGQPTFRPWTDDYVNMLAPLWNTWVTH